MSRSTLCGATALVMLGVAAWAETAPGDVAFADGAVEASLTGAPGDPAQGIRVMTTAGLGNCVACHTVAALPQVEFPGNIGPELDGAGSRWTEAELRGIVTNAKMTFEGSFMPAFYKSVGFTRPGDAFTGRAGQEPLAPILTAQQVEDVVAYLVTLKD